MLNCTLNLIPFLASNLLLKREQLHNYVLGGRGQRRKEGEANRYLTTLHYGYWRNPPSKERGKVWTKNRKWEKGRF